MKKFIFCFIFMLLSFNFIFSQGSDNIETKIFEAAEDSAAFIEVDLYLDKQYFSKTDLVKKLETEYEVEILDNYLTVQTGSGFIITPSGHIITNSHVVNLEDEKKIKEDILNSIIYHFLSKIPSSILSSENYTLLKKEFRTALENSKFYYRALIKNKDFYMCDIELKNKELDAALLKINSNKKFKPLLLGNSDNLKVGNMVMAIGYPLSDIFFFLFKDKKSTMTIGNVSTIRNDNWGIQHTAAINPGNSGGPLLNKNGEVVGINVGLLKESNSIFFSIPSNKIINWLNSNNMQNIVKMNANSGISYNPEYTKNDSGNIEAGQSILIKMPEGYKVYLDGVFKGNTPLYLDNINEGVHTLRVESDSEFIEEQFLIKSSIKEILSYSPFLKKLMGILVVMTSPSGAEVIIDDQSLGVTPLVLNEVTTGKHKLKLKLSGYLQFEKEIDIKSRQKLQINESLIKGFKVLFKNQLPETVQIKIEGKGEEWTFKKTDEIVLEKGNYKIILSNKDFDDKSAEFEITDKDITLDLDFKKYTGFIVFKNLTEGSKVLIDGADMTDKIKDKKLEMDIGKHKVLVEKDKYKDFIKEVTIENGKTEEIAVDYTYQPVEYDFSFYRKVGVGLIIPGAVCCAGGFILVLAGVIVIINSTDRIFPSIYIDNNSDSKIIERDIAIGLFASGGSLLVLGAIFMTAGLNVFNYSQRLKNGLVKLNININNGASFVVTYKF